MSNLLKIDDGENMVKFLLDGGQWHVRHVDQNRLFVIITVICRSDEELVLSIRNDSQVTWLDPQRSIFKRVFG